MFSDQGVGADFRSLAVFGLRESDTNTNLAAWWAVLRCGQLTSLQ